MVHVGEGGDAEDEGAAHDRDQDLGPHRSHREAEALALAPAVDDEGNDGDDADGSEEPRDPLANGSVDAAADLLELRLQAVDAGAA